MTPTEAESLIMEALFTRLKAMTLSPVLPIEWPDEVFVSPDDRRYLRVQLMPNETDRPTVDDDGPSRHMGILQLTLVRSNSQGQMAAREEAGAIADWFSPDATSGSSRMVTGSVVVRSMRRPTVAMSMPDGADLLTPISVSYESYI